MDMVRRIAKAGADGRMLVVNTTNLDDAGSRVFDLVEEAQSAADSGVLERIHNIMLASAGIPGAFPFRIIDQELYVDGGCAGTLPADLSRRSDTQDPLLDHFQQSVPPGAAPDTAEVDGGRSTKPGDGNARFHGHRGEASRRAGGDRPAQAQC